MDWGLTLSKLLTYSSYPLTLSLILSWVCWGLLLKTGHWKTVSLLGFSLLWLTLAANPKFAAVLYHQLENRHPPLTISDTPTADVIITLGGNLAPPQPPRLNVELVQASDRLLHSARLFHAGKAPKIILSGGNVFPQTQIQSEAIYAAQLLSEWGVSTSAILIEGRSRTTYENALYTRQLMDKHGFKHALLVTSASHMPRALATFRNQNINVTPSATDILITSNDNPAVLSWLPSNSALSITTKAIHEYLGIWVYRLRGWIK